jgi:N-acetyl sugar amidotransferase
MRWCARCVLPDTRPHLVIGADGVCNACTAHQSKSAIDWRARGALLDQLIKNTKQKARGYDCVVPVSGGKDSTWQVIQCLQRGLKPLAVTWKTPGRTPIGQRNLDNLVSLGVDHIDYQVNPKVEARFMLKAFERLGSTAIPMHLALFSIPLAIAVRFGIPLVVWGENSAFEYGSPDEAATGFRLDGTWLERHGVTHGTSAADWVGDDLSAKDLAAYYGPDADALEAQGVNAVFLGYYLPWDPDKTREAAVANGFRYEAGAARTGLYDYADIDDDFISLHHWMKWYKFGFTRLFDNLSLEIRNGRLSRADALKIIRERGDDTPRGDIEKFCRFAGIPPATFLQIAEKFRNHDIWQRRADGVWHIPGFLLPDWRWT